MKLLFRNHNHIQEHSHDCLVKEIKDKKVKFTYKAYNAGESLTVEVFDGCKFNTVLTMMDLGEQPNSSAYITLANVKRMERASYLFTIAEEMITKIL